MRIGDVALTQPYTPGSPTLRTNDLMRILLEDLELTPNRVTVFDRASYGSPSQVSTMYSIASLGTNFIALGGVVVGTDRAYHAGDFVLLSATVTSSSSSSATSQIFSWLLGQGANVSVGSDLTGHLICMQAGTLAVVRLAASTGPVGAALIIDILKSTDNGATFTSLWATHPGNRPNIADGSKSGSATSFDTQTYNAGDLWRIDVIQVGSSTPGTGLTAMMQ